MISNQRETLLIGDVQQTYKRRVHRDIFAVDLLVAVQLVQHVCHFQVLTVIVAHTLILVFLLSVMLPEVDCWFAEQALLHALGVLDLRVDECPQLVLQLLNVDLLLDLHQVKLDFICSRQPVLG